MSIKNTLSIIYETNINIKCKLNYPEIREKFEINMPSNSLFYMIYKKYIKR